MYSGRTARTDHPMPGTIYQFADMELDLGRHELRRNSQPVDIQRMPFELLALLLEKNGQLATRQEIITRVWGPDIVVVTDQSINTTVRKLRLALGDDPDRPRFVQTVTGKGYRFVAPFQVVEDAGLGAPAPAGGPVTPEMPPSIPTEAIENGHVERPRGDSVSGPAGDARARHLAFVAGAGAVIVAAALAIVVRSAWTPSSAGPSVPIGKVMLAVLPLENLTGSDEQQFIVDGLHEEIISRLGRLQPERLGVIARTSTLQYKGTTKSIAEIGRELSADYVLEGSVRQAGRRLRVTEQLIQVGDQTHLWVETVERDIEDLLTVQTQIGARVAESLAVDVLPDAFARVRREHELSADAYAAYLRGKYYLNRRALDHPANTLRAVEWLERVVQAAPASAEGHSALGHAYWNLSAYAEPGERQTWLARAESTLATALALEHDLASAHLVLGLIRSDEWNRDGAEREIRFALAQDPNSAQTHQHLARLLAYTGRYAEAERAIGTAQQLDPLDPDAHVGAFYIHLAGRRWDRAEAAAHTLADLAPGTAAQAVTSALLALRGDCNRAVEVSPSLTRLAHEGDLTAAKYPASYVIGRCLPASTVATLATRLERRPDTHAYTLAALHAGAGNTGAAMAWLEESLRRREGPLIFVGVDPMLDSLRKEERFRAVLRETRLASD